ncbi:MAG: prepilin-type N-terminal cleavage/methylation domain-containing protein [Gammaproteobacteria bacterium]|nr:prepilin-type N-terminal cleavage/methylation domain-containing protein [Gammaproteobacteria bacterium]
MKKQQSGFTLVEIAIVMVIIGLLLGGVLKGQEVITNARLKNINNEYNGVSAAVYSYQDRYRALPGDDAAADAHVGGTVSNGTVGTQGNGLIEGAYDADAAAAVALAASNAETLLAWHHLRAAGLISGAATGDSSNDTPSNAVGGITGIESGEGNTTDFIPGLVVGFSALAPDFAQILDIQNDDGDADLGSIVTGTTGTTYATHISTGTLQELFFGF